MEHIKSLSKVNESVTDRLLGRAYSEASANNQLTTVEVIEANEALEEYLYGPEIAHLVRKNAQKQLASLHTEIIKALTAPEHQLKTVDLNRLGIVVVRPEALDLTENSKALLSESKLSILIDKKTRIDFNQYWSLYGPGLADPEARYDFPSRTLNYIDKEIRVIVVAGNPEQLGVESISEYITNELKGSQGSYTKGTLRGDIALNGLKKLVHPDTHRFIDAESSLALDPIGAYRKLVRGDIVSDRMHSSADYPLLFYAGQSMHVPNRLEIERDSRILLNEEDITFICNRLRDE